jgi:transposase
MEPKKRSVGASERDEFVRAAWRSLVAREIHAEQLVFVDEMGANISLAPLYAWSPKGERAFASVPRNWGKNITLLASMTLEGMGECLAVEGSTTTAVFEAYLERVLVPSLRPGQVVVMDNLSAHKGSRVRDLIESKGCELLYLPPYSPDFNPIEEAFAKIKGLLRKAEARSREVLIEAMGRALEALKARDARNFFEHCGYRALGQLL